ncbi:MAG TPA: hypothetical protein VG322_18000 [Candidatus Acidoferrales bacterium]|jgi:hypothetical protein|nr:hypothetical protein [Candidatus Acidoferrales bacterium]
MRHSVDYVVFIVLNNPIPAIGIWLLAASLFLVHQIKCKLTALYQGTDQDTEQETDQQTDQGAVRETIHPFPHQDDWELSAHYLALRSKYGWSPWPVYLMWPCQFSAVLLLLVALFR